MMPKRARADGFQTRAEQLPILPRPIAIERVSDLRLFARIAANGSLSAAARELGMSLGNVSSRLTRLEQALNVRLMHRSTRRLHLTAEGELFLQRVMAIIAAVEALEDSIAGGFDEVSGRLRITCSAAFARRHVAPVVRRLGELHPEITLDIFATDETVDLISEGIDVAIRQSPLPDSNMITRNLIPNDRVACASPDYLKKHGAPQHPEELAAHRCIAIGIPAQTVWPFTGPDGSEANVQIKPSLYISQGDAGHEAALEGAGIALKSRIDVIGDFANGRLSELFPGWTSPGSPIQAVMPSSEQVPVKVRTFLSLLSDSLKSKLDGY
ncbi:LysR family transcriptional regulator [Erythrobacter litoralis]|uniref:LysR family transcriptional regulator n=1 Tax=Erythrobacter litoralis TaxID=39960 RepID=UPI0024357D85|nr:LysR family transcriptional regulator [Erythrobacter litoralis]MDG6080251.1 LysR family transcriptional regulator [Erythrobacter litoralis]